jgi:hypothetical protein
MNLARRLELGSRQKSLALLPEEYCAQADRHFMIVSIVGLLAFASLVVFQNLYPETLASPEESLKISIPIAYLMTFPLVWQAVRSFRRSCLNVARLGKNPFGLSRAQHWFLIGQFFFLCLIVEIALLNLGYIITAMFGLPILLALFIHGFASKSEMSLHENGIFLGNRFYTWDEITWYRWYENRCGIVFGHRTWQVPHLVHYVPAEEIGSDRLEQLLQEYLPSSERETVEEYLSKTTAAD